MADEVPEGHDARGSDRPIRLTMPGDIRSELAQWFDPAEIDEEGFWRWLRTVLPTLATTRRVPGRGTGRSPADRVRELAADLIECAGERARLTIAAEHYVRDNQALARRTNALEAALRTLGALGHGVALPPDPQAEAAADRYLPPR
jgi:hypothetical protein